MASTIYTADGFWSATNRYTAAAETDVKLSAAGGAVFWATTPNDTAPTIEVGNGHVVEAGDSDEMTLNAGDRLWIAKTGSAITKANLET